MVVVEILAVTPNTDLEGDDDFVPLYDNHADIYGFVTIDGETFNLPEISETDQPHWDSTGPRSGVFEKAVTSSPVPISIDIWEGDSRTTFGDDHVDVNPRSDKYHLDFEFDLCSLALRGDVNGSSQSRIESSGGSGSSAATISFKVGMKDARPVTSNDLALIDIDLIQVVPQTSRLVAGRKGTVAMVRIANNHDFTVNTNLHINISGSGFHLDANFPIQIQPGEVAKQYLFRENPFTFPTSGAPYRVALMAEVGDPGSAQLPPGDCRLRNDRTLNRVVWKVVTTRPGFSIVWAKVGTLLDVGNYAPDQHFDEIFELGTSFIEAVYPLSTLVSVKSSFDIQPPPATAAGDFLLTVLSSIQLPVDVLEPIIFLFELNGVAALTGNDRLMGVLPNKDWFGRFSGWSDVTGFSLGEFAPHAVIFEPRSEDNGDIGPAMTLPAHELGHTFGLSTDARLKTDAQCEFDWPIVGHAPCGISGGFDEYTNKDPAFEDGNPCRGYWVANGSEPTAIQPLADHEQCDSHCLMGGSPANAHLDWPARGRWIDTADYDQLVDKLAISADPELIYVSGMISWRNDIYLGRWFRSNEGVPDRTETNGMYGFRFLDEEGRQLREIGLPVAWIRAEYHKPLPVTFFGITLEFPRGAKVVEIWNRGTGTLLATREVDLSVPEVQMRQPERKGDSVIGLRWTARDEEESELTYAVLISPNGESWWPVAHALTDQQLDMDTARLAPGEYLVKVLALNSIRVGTSKQVTFSAP